MMQDIDDTPPVRGLDELQAQKNSTLPPVHQWHPGNCRDIDMRIDRDGRWFYSGSLISRERMVRLFSSIMRRDEDDRYYLVTPAEKCGIEVEDVPFVVTGMDFWGTGQEQVVRFTTNVGDAVAASEATPIRFVEADKPGVYIPYVRVRDRLEARINRAVFYDLVELGQVKRIDGIDWFGLWSGNRFWQIAPAADIGAE